MAEYHQQINREDKNKKLGLWIFISMLIILIIVGVVAWKTIQKPVDDVIHKYANVNVMTIYEGELIRTGLIVYEEGREILNTETTPNGATTFKVYFNNSFQISTFNLENQSYFMESEEMIGDSLEPKSIKFRMVERGLIEVEETVKRRDIIIEIENTEGDFGNIEVCFISRGMVIRNDDRYKKFYLDGYDKCFDLSSNMSEGDVIDIILPYVEISSTPTLTYRIGGVDGNYIIEDTFVGGVSGKINL